MKQLIEIQNELKAPKNQFNSFGKYKYRSQEDILEALKPLLKKYGCFLTISDEIKISGSITFVEASATISNGEEAIKVNAQAGIDPNRKGMDIAQCFGSSSSYARKYALNGLFLIDDTKDADSTNTHEDNTDTTKWVKLVSNCGTAKELSELYEVNKSEIGNDTSILKVFSTRKSQLK